MGVSPPRRLRDELRRATTRLGAAAATFAPARVGMRIPPSVLGAELADVMGDSLRKALRFWDAAPMDDVAPMLPKGRRSATFPPLSSTHGTRSVLPAIGTAPAPRDVGTAAHPTIPARERSAFPPLTNGGRPAVPSRDVAAEHQPATRRQELERIPLERESRDRREPDHPPPNRSTHVAQQRAASPLVVALNAYWTAQRGDGARAGSVAAMRDADGAARAAREHGLQASPEAGIDRLTHPSSASSPVLRAGALPADDAPASAAPRVTRWLPADIQPPSAETESARFPLPAQPVPDWLLGDLADQLADILREQAMDHGVDLT